MAIDYLSAELITRLLRRSDERLRVRLAGIGDEEWFWRPVPDCWTVRSRAEAKTQYANGSGDWVVDYDLPYPDPAPFTTIAWRVLHLALVIAGYLDVLGGYHGGVPWNEYEISNTAEAGIAFFASQMGRLLIAASEANAVTLERPVTIPWWGNQPATFRDVLLVLVDECIHHGAEVGVLRDLYRQMRGE
jgi:hypothetical protein